MGQPNKEFTFFPGDFPDVLKTGVELTVQSFM